MCAGNPIAYKGHQFTIWWASSKLGNYPARDFFDEQDASDQAKLLGLFQRLSDHGRISNRQKFKKLEGAGLWEFKSFQLRFIGEFRSGKRFVLALGLRKKTDLHKKADLKKARRILAEDESLESTERGKKK